MFSVLNAGTTLGGSIWGMTLDSAGNPYLVTQNIVVPVGKTLKINKGCVFLFKPFTGISVDGSIDVNGTREHPVVFTTENDSSYNFNTTQAANPFDWNGIHITDKANHALFRNFLVSYTVFGLKCQTENISIENGVFFQNGQFHFTINEKIQWVQEGFPFSYNVREEKTVQIKSDVFVTKGIPLILGCAGLTSAIFSGLSVKSYTDFQKEFEQTADFELQKDLKDKGRTELTKSLVFGGVSLVTIPAAVILYLKNNKQPEKRSGISFRPALNHESAGALLTFRF
jgi:hypothetical protein